MPTSPAFGLARGEESGSRQSPSTAREARPPLATALGAGPAQQEGRGPCFTIECRVCTPGLRPGP